MKTLIPIFILAFTQITMAQDVVITRDQQWLECDVMSVSSDDVILRGVRCFHLTHYNLTASG